MNKTFNHALLSKIIMPGVFARNGTKREMTGGTDVLKHLLYHCPLQKMLIMQYNILR